MDWERIWDTVSTQLTTFGLRVAGAIAVWIIGRWLIHLAVRLLSAALTFNERGAVLAVRPYTHTDHYWQVYFDTNEAISDTFGAAGYPVPETHVRTKQAA
jgi:small-conductance mechanosensitive channel